MRLLAIGGWLLAGVGLLFFLQHRMIYFPRSYPADPKLLPRLVELTYTTTAGRQTSFYLPPRDGRNMPERIWMLFGGNASLALDWQEFIAEYPDQAAGVLFFDYPGYGRCEGKASPASILESAEAALLDLARHLQAEPAAVHGRLAILGHSLGAAAGLMVAGRHPVERVVLVSPFASLRDMAVRTVGKPLHLLLRHDFDNRARLAELAERTNPPDVTIFHGALDEVIPVAMGRELAGLFPSMVRYVEVPGGDHNGILNRAERDIHMAMQGRAGVGRDGESKGG